MNRFTKLAALGIATASMIFMSCSGSDGKDGKPGADGSFAACDPTLADNGDVVISCGGTVVGTLTPGAPGADSDEQGPQGNPGFCSTQPVGNTFVATCADGKTYTLTNGTGTASGCALETDGALLTISCRNENFRLTLCGAASDQKQTFNEKTHFCSKDVTDADGHAPTATEQIRPLCNGASYFIDDQRCARDLAISVSRIAAIRGPGYGIASATEIAAGTTTPADPVYDGFVWSCEDDNGSPGNTDGAHNNTCSVTDPSGTDETCSNAGGNEDCFINGAEVYECANATDRLFGQTCCAATDTGIASQDEVDEGAGLTPPVTITLGECYIAATPETEIPATTTTAYHSFRDSILDVDLDSTKTGAKWMVIEMDSCFADSLGTKVKFGCTQAEVATGASRVQTFTFPVAESDPIIREVASICPVGKLIDVHTKKCVGETGTEVSQHGILVYKADGSTLFNSGAVMNGTNVMNSYDKLTINANMFAFYCQTYGWVDPSTVAACPTSSVNDRRVTCKSGFAISPDLQENNRDDGKSYARRVACYKSADPNQCPAGAKLSGSKDECVPNSANVTCPAPKTNMSLSAFGTLATKTACDNLFARAKEELSNAKSFLGTYAGHNGAWDDDDDNIDIDEEKAMKEACYKDANSATNCGMPAKISGSDAHKLNQTFVKAGEFDHYVYNHEDGSGDPPDACSAGVDEGTGCCPYLLQSSDLLLDGTSGSTDIASMSPLPSAGDCWSGNPSGADNTHAATITPYDECSDSNESVIDGACCEAGIGIATQDEQDGEGDAIIGECYSRTAVYSPVNFYGGKRYAYLSAICASIKTQQTTYNSVTNGTANYSCVMDATNAMCGSGGEYKNDKRGCDVSMAAKKVPLPAGYQLSSTNKDIAQYVPTDRMCGPEGSKWDAIRKRCIPTEAYEVPACPPGYTQDTQKDVCYKKPSTSDCRFGFEYSVANARCESVFFGQTIDGNLIEEYEEPLCAYKDALQYAKYVDDTKRCEIIFNQSQCRAGLKFYADAVADGNPKTADQPELVPVNNRCNYDNTVGWGAPYANPAKNPAFCASTIPAKFKDTVMTSTVSAKFPLIDGLCKLELNAANKASDANNTIATPPVNAGFSSDTRGDVLCKSGNPGLVYDNGQGLCKGNNYGSDYGFSLYAPTCGSLQGSMTGDTTANKIAYDYKMGIGKCLATYNDKMCAVNAGLKESIATIKDGKCVLANPYNVPKCLPTAIQNTRTKKCESLI